MHGADDRPSGPISRPSIILSQRHDGPSTSDVQRSNLAMLGTDDPPPHQLCSPWCNPTGDFERDNKPRPSQWSSVGDFN